MQCFGTYDDSKFQDVGLDQDWRLWLFQVCTEWGYFSVRIIMACFAWLTNRILNLDRLLHLIHCTRELSPSY